MDQRDEAVLNAAARACGEIIASKLPEEVGFGLLLFHFGPGGFLSWISNGQRGDMVRAVKEWLARVEHPEGNGKERGVRGA